jgi:hypothetical protein
MPRRALIVRATPARVLREVCDGLVPASGTSHTTCRSPLRRPATAPARGRASGGRGPRTAESLVGRPLSPRRACRDVPCGDTSRVAGTTAIGSSERFAVSKSTTARYGSPRRIRIQGTVFISDRIARRAPRIGPAGGREAASWRRGSSGAQVPELTRKLRGAAVEQARAHDARAARHDPSDHERRRRGRVGVLTEALGDHPLGLPRRALDKPAPAREPPRMRFPHAPLSRAVDQSGVP